MKVTKIIVWVAVLAFALNMMGMATQLSVAQSDLPLTDITANQCDTPAKTYYVGTAVNDHYNVSTLNADKNTCIAIVFHNSDAVDHTFRIDADSANSVAYFNLYTDPGATVQRNFMTPNKDMSIEFYCAETGHLAKGMKGTLVVGSASTGGSSTPGFDAISLLFGLVAAVSIVTVYKKKNKRF